MFYQSCGEDSPLITLPAFSFCTYLPLDCLIVFMEGIVAIDRYSWGIKKCMFHGEKYDPQKSTPEEKAQQICGASI